MSNYRLFRYENYIYPHEKDIPHSKRTEIKEMQMEYRVLDHGYVKYIDHMGGEERIIEAARQSTQKGFLGWEKACNDSACLTDEDLLKYGAEHSHPGDEKLLEYLYKNHHDTPFEMVELCIQVKAPIFVFREWHRHRTQSYNEMSARYIQMPNEHYVPEPRMQDAKNKQGSLEIFCDPLPWQQKIRDEQDRIYEDYECDIRVGIAKEVARINTPVSRYSVMYAKANLRNWLHFLNLRLRPNAQLEIRLYAEAVGSIIKELWPRTWDLFNEYTLGAVTLSRSEVHAIRQNHMSMDYLRARLEKETK